MKIKEALKILTCIIFCQMAGIIGSFFTTPNIDTWYKSLNQPSFNPPDWVFAPVWITLFCLIGISLYLVIKDGIKDKQAYLILFVIQILLNISWSIVFFGLKSITGAFIVIILLLVAITLLIIKSFQYSKMASYLLLPYILWVCFAAILNAFYVFLN